MKKFFLDYNVKYMIAGLFIMLILTVTAYKAYAEVYYTYIIDTELCINCEVCVENAPEVYKINTDGDNKATWVAKEGRVISTGIDPITGHTIRKFRNPQGQDEDDAVIGLEMCPVQAISVRPGLL